MIAAADGRAGPGGEPVMRFCAFQVAEHWFAIDASRITEVLREQRTTPVPLAHPAVRGLLNLRGRIVPVIDMRTRLGLAMATDTADGAGRTNIVIEVEDEAFSLLVDRLADVVEFPLRSIEPPTTADRPGQDAIDGVWPTRFGLMHLLDTGRLVAGIAAATAERKAR
jgi:purine-binding chemotaxis protein CheW